MQWKQKTTAKYKHSKRPPPNHLSLFMSIRFSTSVLISKIVQNATRLSGSGGSSLPGLICMKLCPNALTYFAQQCEEIILVAGTNGKTTTCRVISNLLDIDIVHNKSGSNMLRGHLSAFISKSSWTGKIKTKTALLEVDEAILPKILKQIQPTKVVLLNLFRDQLDRYGEVDSIARKWEKAIQANLKQGCTVYINADDPNLAYLGEKINRPNTVYWGIDDPSIGTKDTQSTSDANLSPKSGGPLKYNIHYLSHLGDYYDTNNSFTRPELTYWAENCQIDSDQIHFDLKSNNTTQILDIDIKLPGIYNLYNVLGAIVSTITVSNSTEDAIKIKSRLNNIKGAFGRHEKIQINNQTFTLCLIKNPAGTNEVLKTLANNKENINLILLANDNFADGIDVSWYWDSNFESICPKINFLVCGGNRANDMGLRLKYAGYANQSITENDIVKIISGINDGSISNHFSDGQNFILSTYTATLEVQKILKKMKIKEEYWKE